MKFKIPIDKVVEKIAGLGVPGIVLVVKMGATGFTGAAALTTALAFFGGPFGMLGGIATLGVTAFIASAIIKYGYKEILKAVLKEHIKRGKTKQEILRKIKDYPISKSLKVKIEFEINRYLKCKE